MNNISRIAGTIAVSSASVGAALGISVATNANLASQDLLNVGAILASTTLVSSAVAMKNMQSGESDE